MKNYILYAELGKDGHLKNHDYEITELSPAEWLAERSGICKKMFSVKLSLVIVNHFPVTKEEEEKIKSIL